MADVDSVFADPGLADLYDLFNPWMACDDFYKARAVASGGPILDVGCGTGMLACAIAAEGLEVVGVDPAEGMLRVARARPGSERVTWVQAAGQAMDLGREFAFAYMTGHAFQALLTDADAVAVLRAVGRHLAPGGQFVFETRNPAHRAWERWAPTRRTADSPALGRVEEVHDAVHEPATGLVAMETCYRLLDAGEERKGSSRLRFVDHDHLASLIAEAGLRSVARLGSWDGAPFDPERSPEIIAIVRQT